MLHKKLRGYTIFPRINQHNNREKGKACDRGKKGKDWTSPAIWNKGGEDCVSLAAATAMRAS